MQGDRDTCIYCSLASALHATGLKCLTDVCNALANVPLNFAKGIGSLNLAKNIVSKHVPWMKAKQLKPKAKFDWQNCLRENSFLLASIEDNLGNACHTVCVFRGWIFDSNEPYAIPLCEESLNSCTWEIQDEKLKNHTSFVCFQQGWIFWERTFPGKKSRMEKASPVAWKRT